jgi:hypothetical protein
MSGVYLYCIVPAGTLAGDRTGIDGAAVEVAEESGLAAWYSVHDERPAPGARRIREHAAVAAAPLDLGVTPVPFRFGQWLRDATELRARLRSGAEHWRELLQTFAGACELAVRAAWEEPASAREMQEPPESGRAYLEAVARRRARAADLRRRGEAIAAKLRQAVAGIPLRERVDTGAGAAVEIAHLVRRGDSEEYRARIARTGETLPGVALRVSGPWPPYSFVE